MAIPNVMNTGRSGMMAARAAISTTGHNITNANTEGYSRQRVHTTPSEPHPHTNHSVIGTGTQITRIDRVNDEYLEKQLRNTNRELAHADEKDVALRQTEDIFNEMNGDGINRLMSRFFNEFRKLSNEPDNEAVRQSLREASQAMINDFRRVRKEIEEVRRHIDSRIDGYVTDANRLGSEVKELNDRIRQLEVTGGSPNDLLDRRDQALKELSGYLDLSVHKDKNGNVNADLRGVGPFITGASVERLDVVRSKADDQGMGENSLMITTTGSVSASVTHVLKGGKIGALLEVRDQTLSGVLDRLDELAYNVADSVNQIHRQGFSRMGVQGVDFFKQPPQRERAAEFFDLSDEVASSVNNIATAAVADSPGDNRVALAISGLQGMRLMSDGKATADDFYNSIVGDVGVVTARNRATLNQQKDIKTQLGKMRDQISGVSIDEETANLLQFQHMYDASAKMIAVADEMMKTVLDLKR